MDSGDADGYFGEASRPPTTTGSRISSTLGHRRDRWRAGRLAGNGRALELAIGTGRIALPLAARGVEVHGIDLSRAMVARLRAKPGGDAITVAIGDIATTTMDGTFALVYLVFNTIDEPDHAGRPGGLLPQRRGAPGSPAAASSSRSASPSYAGCRRDRTSLPLQVSSTRWAFDLYDTATQAMSSNYITVTDGRGEYRSIPFRYVWPSELDLMARLAGMRLRDRWEDWTRTPFTGDSRKHVSVWEKA